MIVNLYRFLNGAKVEDGKLKIPVGKDKSITIGGAPGGKGIGASIGFEWKFGKRTLVKRYCNLKQTNASLLQQQPNDL